MITGFIINSFYVLLYNIIELFPDGGVFPSYIHSVASTIGNYVYAVDPYLPVVPLFNVWIASMGLMIVITGIKLSLWFVSFARGSSTPVQPSH